MENSSKNRIYQFDVFRLDADKLMLYRDGQEVSMPPKMVRTLVVLVESPGIIISKDDLIERVWEDSIVDESNLSQHLYHLRKILGKHPDGRPYIETLRRRGFRFNGDVVAVVVQPPTANHAIAGEPATSHSHSHPSVQRSGNVLRLEDWKSAPERAPKAVAEDLVPPVQASAIETGSPAPRPRFFTTTVLVVAAALLLAVTLTAAFVTYQAGFGGRSASATNELTIVRLTNGLKPLDVALSPDGSQFVYHEVTESGEVMWLQQVGLSSRVEIGGTVPGGSYGPKTFSPDGKSVYLSTFTKSNGSGTLFKIPLLGGPQRKVLDNVRRPVSFSPDGARLALIRENKPGDASQMVIANADGSDEKVIVTLPEGQELHGSPAWSPDGSTIVFAATGLGGDNPADGPALHILDVSNGSIRRLGTERWDTVYRIVWTPDGSGLAMIATRANEGYSTRRDQVYLISYPDAQSRRLTTDGSRHQAWSLGIGKDDTILAVPYNRSSQIWSMDASGEASTAFQISRGIGDGRAGISPLPDGRIGFIARTGEEIDAWVMNPDGSDLRQLTNGLQAAEELRSDPLGRYFFYSGLKDKHNHLYRFDADGKNLKQITFGDGHEIDSTVSPDGSRMVFGSSIRPELYSISLDGGEPERIRDARCFAPHFSTDGAMLSCIFERKILVISSSDGKLINEYALPFYALDNLGARWTPDGKALAFISTETGNANIWIQPIDGGDPRQLTTFTNGDVHFYAFSIDGTRLYVARGLQITDAILIRDFR